MVPVSSFHTRLSACGERSSSRSSSGRSHHCSVRSSKNLRFSRAGVSTTVSFTTPLLTQSAWVQGSFGTTVVCRPSVLRVIRATPSPAISTHTAWPARWARAGLRNPALAHRAGQAVWVEMAGDGVARITRKTDGLHTTVVPNEPWTQALWVNNGVVNDTVVLTPARENRRFFDERTEQWCERPELDRLLERSPHALNRVWNDETGTIWGTHSEGLVRFTPKGADYEMDLSSFDLINDRYPTVQVLPGSD